MKRVRYTALGVALLLAAATSLHALKDDHGLGRNMEILVNMMRALSTDYVDDVRPDKLMEDAAAGMVGHLDPYTVYLPEEEMSNFEIMSTGKYGGVGSLIRQRDNGVVFAQPYAGSPADRAGLKIGDRIVAIGDENAEKFTTDEVSRRLKGDPGTTVDVTVERLYTGRRERLTLRRERISIPSIPYYGMLSDSIGYLHHSDFTIGCAEEVRRAIDDLHGRGMKALVLDLRGNGGGVMQEAVKMLALFMPKGTAVLTTRGRDEKSEERYRTEQQPRYADLPLAVLINGNTASAAEIVAGALQDLDRAVLVGQKSFGKGLVQSTMPLGYNAYLKLTTAKYYIPSGRCIQAIDYSRHTDDRGEEVPDSLVRRFATAGGREVFDGGGITPDVKLEPQYVSRFAMTLYALGFIDEWGDEYMKRHYTDSVDVRTFSITDDDYADFVRFMEDKEVPYQSETRRVLKRMKEAAKSDNFAEVTAQLETLEKGLRDDTATNLETYRNEIVRSLNSNIILRHAYQAGVAEHELQSDREVARAAELLRRGEQHELLKPVRTE